MLLVQQLTNRRPRAFLIIIFVLGLLVVRNETGTCGKTCTKEYANRHPRNERELRLSPTESLVTSNTFKQSPAENEREKYKVICYFTNWAWNRQGPAQFLPENIDSNLCTHIIYSFAVLNEDSLFINIGNSLIDIDNKFYERVNLYKGKGKKVLVAIGGWNDSASDKYSKLVNNPAARKKFIADVIHFIEKYGFDGLDLHWEYPVCWQVDCNEGPKSDKSGFSRLVVELSNEFRPRGLLLSSVSSANRRVIDEGYDVPVLSQYLDWITVLTYNYHGQWDKITGHVAPMYYHPDDVVDHFNVNYTINYWISKGAPSRKLIIGIPLFGQAFTLYDTSDTGLNSLASVGTMGEFTKSAGILAYYEICDRIQNKGWQVVQDSNRRMGPYAYKNHQWVSFDDSDMIRRKAQYVKDMNLGGGMIWSLDLDDFWGRCGNGSYPLTHALQQILVPTPDHRDDEQLNVTKTSVTSSVDQTSQSSSDHLLETMTSTTSKTV